jgi:nicotinamidase/pyrazinamidase
VVSVKKKIEIASNDTLVIVDAQNDFVREDGKLYVRGVVGESDSAYIISGIKAMHAKFTHRFVTEDEHPKGHIEFGIFGEHCLAGSDGQKYVDELSDEYLDSWKIKKGQSCQVISYSASTSQDFVSYVYWMRSRKIKRIFLVGFAYTHCVGESAIAYACQGFEVYVIRDLTRSVPEPYGDPKGMKKKLKLYGVKEIFLKDIE